MPGGYLGYKIYNEWAIVMPLATKIQHSPLWSVYSLVQNLWVRFHGKSKDQNIKWIGIWGIWWPGQRLGLLILFLKRFLISFCGVSQWTVLLGGTTAIWECWVGVLGPQWCLDGWCKLSDTRWHSRTLHCRLNNLMSLLKDEAAMLFCY